MHELMRCVLAILALLSTGIAGLFTLWGDDLLAGGLFVLISGLCLYARHLFFPLGIGE